jgi:hypothetical protein
MTFSVLRVVGILLSAVAITYVVFELMRPDIILVGNVTVDVLHGGSIGATQASSRPGGVTNLLHGVIVGVKHCSG